MKALSLFSLVVAFAAVSCGPSSAPVAGAPATGGGLLLASVGGKQVSLEDLSRECTAFFYFIKPGCPVNTPVVKYYDRIAAAYDSSVPFVAIIKSDASKAGAWAKEQGTKFELLADAQGKAIEAMHAERSPWVVEVLPGGKIGRKWSQVSKSILEDLNRAVAAAHGVEPAQVDFEGAPETERSGCQL